MTILLHTSKTMRLSSREDRPKARPQLLEKARELASYLRAVSSKELQASMHISPALAEKTHKQYSEWGSGSPSPALDSFIGDIYSGLQADTLSEDDRAYAQDHLRILSGLYGILRPDDGIWPYRLEMGYRLPDIRYRDLYKFWGDAIAVTLPTNGPVINLASVEYSRTVTPYIDTSRVITPRFLTLDPKTNEPKFVVVHAKIARGAFARWLVTERVSDARVVTGFAEIGYEFMPDMSTPLEPVFMCREFGGKGRSIRLR